MATIRHLPSSIVLVLFMTNAYADIYRCKDSTGRVITSDRAIAECADKTTDVYSNSLILKNQLPGTLTPEQKRAAELLEQQRIREIQQQERIKEEQRYLTAHYPTENDVEIARQKALDAIDAKIAAEKQVIKEATENLNNKQHDYTHRNNGQQNATEEDLKATIQQSDRLIQRYLAERGDLDRRYDAIHKRYLEIVGADKPTKPIDPS